MDLCGLVARCAQRRCCNQGRRHRRFGLCLSVLVLLLSAIFEQAARVASGRQQQAVLSVWRWLLFGGMC